MNIRDTALIEKTRDSVRVKSVKLKKYDLEERNQDAKTKDKENALTMCKSRRNMDAQK